MNIKDLSSTHSIAQNTILYFLAYMGHQVDIEKQLSDEQKRLVEINIEKLKANIKIEKTPAHHLHTFQTGETQLSVNTEKRKRKRIPLTNLGVEYKGFSKSTFTNTKEKNNIETCLDDSETSFIGFAVGKLVFFDYYKNKFGRISDLKCLQEEYTGLIRFSESGLSSRKRLSDNQIIAFTLHKGNSGFYATDVKAIDEIGLKEVTRFKDLLEIEVIDRIVYDTTKYDHALLDEEDKYIFGEMFLKEKSTTAWTFLLKLKSDEYVEKYIDLHLKSSTDEEKTTFLKHGFNLKLLEEILLKWSSKDKVLIQKLIEVSKYFNNNRQEVPQSFVNILLNIEWSFNELYNILEQLKNIEIAYQTLNLFSFKQDGYFQKLNLLASIVTLDKSIMDRLRNNILKEANELEVTRICEIFKKQTEYLIIENQNALLELLRLRSLTYSEYYNLLKLINENCNIELLRTILSNSSKDISSRNLIELVKFYKKKFQFATIFIDEYLLNKGNDIEHSFISIVEFLRVGEVLALRNYFLNKISKPILKNCLIGIFELAIVANHSSAQKLVYENIFFESEEEILRFIDKFESYRLSDEIKLSNKPLSDFIYLLKSDNIDILSENCKSFLQLNDGLIQCFCIKFLIYKYYKKRLTKENLIRNLESIKWTEISALLIKGFVEESTYTEKILLEKLSRIFKAHFEILAKRQFDPKSFINNFTIRNILNFCDGRKYYNADLWKKNGTSRWYVSGEASFYIKEKLNCYCEGRPWKKEFFWDSETNERSSSPSDFYWCKTSYCAARNDNVNLEKPFFQWTLSEISVVFNITIEKIALATLAGWTNRMNQIVMHLFCRNCNEVLRPLPFRPKILGYYAVPLFQCINDSCKENQVIRFTHCLNSKCESHVTSEPLDSRDCESCKPNEINHSGLKCNYCGSGCPSCSGFNNPIIAQDSW